MTIHPRLAIWLAAMRGMYMYRDTEVIAIATNDDRDMRIMTAMTRKRERRKGFGVEGCIGDRRIY